MNLDLKNTIKSGIVTVAVATVLSGCTGGGPTDTVIISSQDIIDYSKNYTSQNLGVMLLDNFSINTEALTLDESNRDDYFRDGCSKRNRNLKIQTFFKQDKSDTFTELFGGVDVDSELIVGSELIVEYEEMVYGKFQGIFSGNIDPCVNISGPFGGGTDVADTDLYFEVAQNVEIFNRATIDLSPEVVLSRDTESGLTEIRLEPKVSLLYSVTILGEVGYKIKLNNKDILSYNDANFDEYINTDEIIEDVLGKLFTESLLLGITGGIIRGIDLFLDSGDIANDVIDRVTTYLRADALLLLQDSITMELAHTLNPKTVEINSTEFSSTKVIMLPALEDLEGEVIEEVMANAGYPIVCSAAREFAEQIVAGFLMADPSQYQQFLDEEEACQN
ncbi:MAG: hypothetical protein JKY24_08370 [Pseudomonadales bacterium]|nr:hypothetical protein [Pseudomonadales bacterium]